MSNCYRYAKHSVLSYDAITLKVTITIQAPQHVHIRIIIVYALYSPRTCGERKFSSSSSSDSTELPRLKRKRSAHVASKDTTKGKRERKALLKGKKKWCKVRRTSTLLTYICPKQIMNGKDIGLFCSSKSHNSRAALHVLSSDTLPHHVLCVGAVKRATLYSGFIQLQSSSFLFFNLKRRFTVFYGLNLV